MVSLRQKRREILKYRYDELMRKALAKAFPDLPEWVPQAPRREKKGSKASIVNHPHSLGGKTKVNAHG